MKKIKLLICIFVVSVFFGCPIDGDSSKKDLIPCDEVSGLVATIGDGEITLHWNNPEDDDFSHIRYTLLPGNGKSVEVCDSQQVTIKDLVNDTPYSILVETVDIAGNVSKGVCIAQSPAAVKDLIPPGEISNLNIVSDIGKAAISWTNPVDEDLNHIRIIYEDIIVIYPPSTQSLELNDIKNWTKYEIKICTVDNAGNISAGIVDSIHIGILNQKFHSSAMEEYDLFGKSVAISGDFMAVGALCAADMKGEVYLYKKSWNGWDSKILKSPLLPSNRFGYTVALSEGHLVASEPYFADSATSQSGRVWSFKNTFLSVNPPSGAKNRQFGLAVAVHNDGALSDIIAVGDPYEEDGVNPGSVYLYKRDLDTVSFIAELKSEGSTGNDGFGYSIEITDNYIFVGAPWAAFPDEHTDGSPMRGGVFVFERVNDIWTQTGILRTSDGNYSDSFGFSISCYDNTLAVSALWDSDNGDKAGSVYIFTKSESSWIESEKLLMPDGNDGDEFGRSVAIFDDLLIVGAPFDDDNYKDSGSAHVFQRSTSGWKYVSKLNDPASGEGASFGYSVDLYDDIAVIGGLYALSNGVKSGAAWTYWF